MSSIKYTKLETDTASEEGYDYNDHSSAPSTNLWRNWRSLLSLIANSLLFACSMMFFAASLNLQRDVSSSPHCKADLFSGILPDGKSLDHYETKVFQDVQSSVYRQQTLEGEEAWNRLVKVDPFSIPQETLKQLGNPQNASTFPEHLGGGYAANIAVFHQLHCLKTVWQFTYFDHFKHKNHMFHDPPEKIHKHIDHCVDMLRQALMCSPDTSIVPFTWTPYQKLPFPYYEVPRTCRNFEEILEWGHEHAVTWPGEDGFERPEWHVQMFP